MKKLTAVLAAMSLIACVSCGEDKESSVDKSTSEVSTTTEVTTETTTEEVTEAVTESSREDTSGDDFTISILDSFIEDSDGRRVYDYQGNDIIYQIIDKTNYIDDMKTMIIGNLFDDTASIDINPMMSVDYESTSRVNGTIINDADGTSYVFVAYIVADDSADSWIMYTEGTEEDAIADEVSELADKLYGEYNDGEEIFDNVKEDTKDSEGDDTSTEDGTGESEEGNTELEGDVEITSETSEKGTEESDNTETSTEVSEEDVEESSNTEVSSVNE